jgi:hypothetical protein|tara:strand:+ start:613 stop:837 length:225 start_codon:yes stop_codon:yes gene_type:complete
MSKDRELILSIKKVCETTIKCNERIMDEQFKDYDGRYYDEQREEYTILETENLYAASILAIIEEHFKETENETS